MADVGVNGHGPHPRAQLAPFWHRMKQVRRRAIDQPPVHRLPRCGTSSARTKRSSTSKRGAPPGNDVIIDIVAGAAMPSFFARLNPNGRMVVMGVVAGYPPADFGITMMADFQKSPSFATFSTDTVPEPGRHAVRTGSSGRVAESCRWWCTSCCRWSKPC